MKKIWNLINSFLRKGEQRSILAKKNIIYSFLIKIFSVPISFILIPLTIGYVDAETYGIWITVSSIVMWMSFFDIGINNGLKNRLVESIAFENNDLSKRLVSTTYAILIIISSCLFTIFYFVNQYLDWSKILNTSTDLSKDLAQVALIVVGFFCFKFVLSTINVILLANQMPAAAAFRAFIEQISSLIVILILINFTEGSILNLAYGLCFAPIIVLIYMNITLFRGKFKHLSPSFKYVDFSILHSILGIGYKFFIIQIAGIIQFEAANFIIIRNYGPSEVSIYNVVFKYFSVLTMVMAIFLAPFWSSVTDAFYKNDFLWIDRAKKKYLKMSILLVTGGFIMLIVSPFVYEIWLGKNVLNITFQNSLLMYIFSSVGAIGSVYCTILNGIGALNVQFKASILSPFVFVLLSFLFMSYFKLGINSIILASIIANFNAYILAPIQYNSILKKYVSTGTNLPTV